MRIALYARVSTPKRKGDASTPAADRDYEQNPALQLAPMRAHAEAQGWKIVGPTDPDHGVCYFDRASGADPSRPMFKRLLEDASRRKFDAVMVWKFDRMSRGALHLMQVLDTLNGFGVDFISITERVDTTTPTGRVIFTILAAFAQFERDMIRERVKAGLTSARSRGVKFGRPRVPVPVLLLEEDIAAGMDLTAAARKRGVNRETARRALQAYRAQKSVEPEPENPKESEIAEARKPTQSKR